MKEIEYHYFFYGMCTENVLSGLIRDALAKGCEFVQLIPQMIPAPKARLVGANNQPQLIPVMRLFVRCLISEFPRIQKEMDAEAAKQRSEGLQ